MRQDYQEKFEQVVEFVKTTMASAPGCHDFDHIRRVLHNARLLATQEAEVNLEIVELAAVLHDIARPEEMNARGKICHAELGAEKAPEILREHGFTDPEFIQAVTECIKKHRYRGNTAPEKLEEKIIYDADKLDSAGAVGIGRAFHFAGRIGARLHNTEAEALTSESYSSEDSAYREYLVKLSKIPDRMLTQTGKKIALERAEFMKLFFERLNREVYG